MSRRGTAPKREILPDPKYHDMTLAKFINCVMTNGKKSLAERIVYGALQQIEQRTGGDSIQLFNRALEAVAPVVEVKSRRVGGASYQVPVEVRAFRRQALAMRWLIEKARKRGEKSMMQRLAGELLDAAAGRGEAVRHRQNVHRMAEANRAFSHYRF